MRIYRSIATTGQQTNEPAKPKYNVAKNDLTGRIGHMLEIIFFFLLRLRCVFSNKLTNLYEV